MFTLPWRCVKGLRVHVTRCSMSSFTICDPSPKLNAIERVEQELMSRTEVVKRLWKHVRENQLQDPDNKQNFIPDERMEPIFGSDLVRGFGIAKYLKEHIG